MEQTPTKEIILKLIAWIEGTADFAKEQWPDYVAQYMRAACVKSWIDVSILLFLFFITIGVFIACVVKTYTWEGKSYDLPFFVQMGCFLPFMFMVPLVGALVNEIHTLISIYVSPKVYILQHLKSFF